MLQHIYEPAAYDASSLKGCFWPDTTSCAPDFPAQEGAEQTEFAVIGAGFTGLSAALHLARSGARVTVLDMHQPGWGASGRNGGFCCLGGAKASAASLIRRFGEADLRRFRQAEISAIDLVRSLIESHDLSVDAHSQGGELLLAHHPSAMAQMRAEAAGPHEYAAPSQIVEREDLRARGMWAEGCYGGAILPLGFALNPRKYVLGLADAAGKAGVTIHADSPVQEISRDGTGYLLTTPRGQLRARHLLLATNGYSSENLPDWMRARYLPVQSSVLVTRPLTGDEIAAQGWSTDFMAYDSRQLLHYFRLMPDRRFLFGMRGGIAWRHAAHERIRRLIRRDFRTMFPAWADVETPWFWSGLANLTRNLTPYVGRVGDWPNAHAAFGYHGNGVAMGTWCGAQMARLALGQPTELPDALRAAPRRFELGAARRLALRGAYIWYWLREGSVRG